MKLLYHGSCQSGLSRLVPKKSTHGTYVCATPYKELAIIFSKKCGDNLTFSLFRTEKDGPWQVVERIPNGFEKMYQNASSVYMVEDTTFIDIKTGFSEVVSEVEVKVQKEETIENVYEAILELERQGKVVLYHYPDRPNQIPIDDSDLLEKELTHLKRQNCPVSKARFQRLLYLHPNLLDKVNEILEALGMKPYQKEELAHMFSIFVMHQLMNPMGEEYLASAYLMISNVYPELIPQMQETKSILERGKKEQINALIDFFSNRYPEMPILDIERVRHHYMDDGRDFPIIVKELLEEIEKLVLEKEQAMMQTHKK